MHLRWLEELSAAYNTFNNYQQLLKMAAAVYEKGGNTAVEISLESILPRFEPSIYLANIERLGILGPSVLSDVVEVFQMLIYSTGTDPPQNSLGLWLPRLSGVTQRHIRIGSLIKCTSKRDFFRSLLPTESTLALVQRKGKKALYARIIHISGSRIALILSADNLYFPETYVQTWDICRVGNFPATG